MCICIWKGLLLISSFATPRNRMRVAHHCFYNLCSFAFANFPAGYPKHGCPPQPQAPWPRPWPSHQECVPTTGTQRTSKNLIRYIRPRRLPKCSGFFCFSPISFSNLSKFGKVCPGRLPTGVNLSKFGDFVPLGPAGPQDHHNL